VPAKKDRLSLVDLQVRQRLPLVDLKGKRLAIGEQKLTCEILTGGLCLQREREAVVGGFK
jgi:hypothetical protein